MLAPVGSNNAQQSGQARSKSISPGQRTPGTAWGVGRRHVHTHRRTRAYLAGTSLARDPLAEMDRVTHYRPHYWNPRAGRSAFHIAALATEL